MKKNERFLSQNFSVSNIIFLIGYCDFDDFFLDERKIGFVRNLQMHYSMINLNFYIIIGNLLSNDKKILGIMKLSQDEIEDYNKIIEKNKKIRNNEIYELIDFASKIK